MLCLKKTNWNNITQYVFYFCFKPARSVHLWHLDSEKKKETTNRKKENFPLKKRTKGTEDRTNIVTEFDP